MQMFKLFTKEIVVISSKSDKQFIYCNNMFHIAVSINFELIINSVHFGKQILKITEGH